MMTTGTPATVARLRLVASHGRRIDHHGRQLHILDVENGVGMGAITQDDVAELKSLYWDCVQPRGDAQFIGATSSSSGLVAAALGWGTGPRWLHEDGPDGADQCLVEELAHPKTAERYTHVVILSGDHAFAEVVRALVASGVFVTVVSRPTSLNYRLRQNASEVIYLPETSPVPAAKVA